eukprot:COSAG02_NODE_418_length_22698_cov_7.471127_1_plen_2519_part_00
MEAILSADVDAKMYRRPRIPDLFSMSQRFEYAGRVRPPVGLQLSLIRLIETVVWQFLPDFLGVFVLAIALSDFGSTSCLWIGYIGLTLHLLFISHEIIASTKHHRVNHMRRVLKKLRLYNFAHLSIQSIYLLIQALWNKGCLQALDPSECACNETFGGACCVSVAGVCVRNHSYVDSMLPLINSAGAASGQPDEFGKLIGLSSSTDRERANFTCGAVLLIVFWFASSAMNQPAFDRHNGGATYIQEREWKRARLRKLVSLVRRLQIRSASIQKLWSSTEYVKTLMDKLDTKGDGASTQLGLSTKDARKEQATIWGTDTSSTSTRTESVIQSVKIEDVPTRSGTASTWQGNYYPVATSEGTAYREAWSAFEIFLHRGFNDFTDPREKQAAGFDDPDLKGKDRWVVRKIGFGGDESIDYFVAPVRSAVRKGGSSKFDQSPQVPWDQDGWQTATWSPEHPNWDGPNWDDLEDHLHQGILVSVIHEHEEKWPQKIKRNIDWYLISKARAAMKAKFGHLTGKWVEPMLDFGRLSNGDLCYLICEHMYMSHISHLAKLLIMMHTLSQSDLLAMPMFVSLFLHANMHYPRSRSGFWLSAMAWTILEMLLRFILQLDFDFGNWRTLCKEEHTGNFYSAVSNCAFVDDGDYEWYLVPLLFVLLHTRESMRRQGEWRDTSACILFVYGLSFFLVALLVHDRLGVLIAVLVCVATAIGLSFNAVVKQGSKDEPDFRRLENHDSLIHKSVSQCKYCENYLRKRTKDQVQQLSFRSNLNHGNVKPCLYRVTPQRQLERGVLCEECGSSTIYRVERPDKDPAAELAQGRNVDTHMAAEMVIVNATFCPTMLERLYEGREAIGGHREIQGCTKNGQKMVEHAFVWSSVVKGKSVLVMVVEPTHEFHKAEESRQDREERMKRYLNEHMEQHQAHVQAEFGARSTRKIGWPEHLKVPTRVHIEPHVPGSVSKFCREKNQSIVKKSRIELRHTFAGVLRELLQPDTDSRMEPKSDPGLQRWINFGYPGARAKWRITAYIRVHCTGLKYALDAKHRAVGQTDWDDAAISDLVNACREKPKRSRFVRLVPRSLVIENETDPLEPDDGTKDTTKGYWTPFCEFICAHATVTAATCDLAEDTVWQYIKTNEGLPKESHSATTLDGYCRKGFSGLQFIVAGRIRSQVENRLALLNKLQNKKAFEKRHTINTSRSQVNDVQRVPRFLALAKEEICNFYEQYWLRDASILKLEEKMSGQNKNSITRICREAQIEMNSGKALQSAATYAVAVELFILDSDSELQELQGEMTLTFLLEHLRVAARKLQALSEERYHKHSYTAAIELLEAAIDLYSRLFECCRTQTGRQSSNRYFQSDTRYFKELRKDHRQYTVEVGDAYRAEDGVAVQSAELVTVIGRQLKQTWGVAKEDICVQADGVRLKAILKGDILRVVDAYSSTSKSTNGSQQLSVEYRVRHSAFGDNAQPICRYAWCASRQVYQLDADQVETIEFLPRPQQMRVIHDFHADKPAQLGWQQHHPNSSDGISMLNFYIETTTVDDWKSQPRRPWNADHGAKEPHLTSWYGQTVRAGSILIVIDQQLSGPWAVGFVASNPSIFGEIPSSFIVPAPRVPEIDEAVSGTHDLLPSQRALIDVDSTNQIGLSERDFTGEPTLREFEQEYNGFPSLHRDGVDLYTRAFLCEMSCLWLGMYVYARANAIDLNLSIGAAGQADAGDSTLGLVALMVGQFVFIMADRAAYLTQSIRAKIVLLWLSCSVYMTLFFGVFSVYTVPPCKSVELDTSAKEFCDTSATTTTNASAATILALVGLIVCLIMRWSYLPGSNGSSNENLLGIMGGMLGKVIWAGVLTVDDLTVIIETIESLCYVSLFWALLDRDLTFFEVLFFCLKAYYWYLSAEQIRYGYKLEAGKLSAQLLTSSTTMVNHYLYILWTVVPFLNEIRVAWDWTWCQTTLEYYDAVKLDQMQRFTYLAHCRLQRLNEVGRQLGEPQKVFYRLMYGLVFGVVFTGCLWGPMLLFVSSIQFYTYNINDASLTVDLQLNRLNVQLAEFTLHETLSMRGSVESFQDNMLLFTDAVSQGSGDAFDLKQMYAKVSHASAFWSRKDTYVEQVQSIAIGMYPSQTWRATRHTRRQIVADLNATLGTRSPSERDRVATSSRQCDVPGTACLIFTLTFEKSATASDNATLGQQIIRFPENVVLGYETTETLAGAINATLAETTAILQPEDAYAQASVRIDNAIVPVMILKHDGTQADVLPPDAVSSSEELPRIPLNLALRSEQALQGSIQEWYWTVSATGIGADLLNDKNFFASKHCGDLSERCTDTWGLCLAVLNDKYPLDDTGLAILELGMFAIYATFIYAVASAYKLWTYKTMRDILLTDMDRTKSVWSKIQDINTARALAKRNKDYFMVEEKLWWDLHSTFRDPAKLYGACIKLFSVDLATAHCCQLTYRDTDWRDSVEHASIIRNGCRWGGDQYGCHDTYRCSLHCTCLRLARPGVPSAALRRRLAIPAVEVQPRISYQGRAAVWLCDRHRSS